MTDTPPKNEDSLRGFGFALSAYFLWGFLPLYMKALGEVPAAEIVAHRVLWSVPVALAILWMLGRTSDLMRALRTPSMLGMAAVTAALISFNWGVYIWAIISGHALDAALGYYINPLFSIFLGAVLLGERMTRVQMLAIALATLAVAVLTWEAGRLPLVALALTVSWGFYAYLKKRLPIGPNQGFTLEVLILLPPALVYLGWLIWSGQSHFATGNTRLTGLLLGAGVVTALPLMLYANGAKLLRLSTIGIMQYIAPTMIFLIAIFIFQEPFSAVRMVAFVMIWAALALYTSAMIASARG